MSRTQLEQLWECGDLTRVFGGDITTVPWPRAPKGALSRDGLDTLVGGLRGAAPTLIDVDPRTLWANQPSLVRHCTERPCCLAQLISASGRRSSRNIAVSWT